MCVRVVCIEKIKQKTFISIAFLIIDNLQEFGKIYCPRHVRIYYRYQLKQLFIRRVPLILLLLLLLLLLLTRKRKRASRFEQTKTQQ
jgi:hypothetical protein